LADDIAYLIGRLAEFVRGRPACRRSPSSQESV
jgi:hypothetical protein